jgi:hypothetical protein
MLGAVSEKCRHMSMGPDGFLPASETHGYLDRVNSHLSRLAGETMRS